MNLGLGNTIPINSVRQGLGGGGGGGGFDNTYSLAFDGVDDYVDTGISTLTGTDFSISYWFKTTATLTNFNYYVPFSAVTNQQFVGAYLYYHPTTKLTFRSRNSSGTLVKGTVDLSDGNWHNIVVTYDSTSYALKMYVDGSIDYDETIYSYAVFNQPLLLGGKSSSLNLIDCSIDEASLFNSVLTSENVTSIYNSGVPNDISSISGLTAWYRNGDNGSYKSPQWLIPNNSNVANSRISNYSFDFDGVNDYIDTGSNPLIGEGNLSISAWFKSSDVDFQYLLGDNSLRFNIKQSNGDTRISFTGSVDPFRGFGVSYSVGNWNNIILTFDGSLVQADRLKLYHNGVEINNINAGTPNTTLLLNTAANLMIGRAGSTSSNPWNGSIDEVATWNTTLTQENITSIYGGGTPSAISSLSPISHWRMGEQANFTSNWLVNNSALSNYSTRSFNFDGVDDYIDFGNPASLQITTDLSVSFWFKGSSTADQAIVAKDALGLRCWGIWNNVFGAGNNLQFYIFNSNSLTEVQTSANYNDGNWHNVVCVFKPSTYLRIYVDGVLDGENTTSIPATIDNDAANLTVGAIVSSGSPIYEFEGNVDEVAIWNSDQSSNVSSIYSSGTPSAITGAVSHWRMGEQATFSTNWNVPDNGSASNTGTSANMTIADLEGDAPNYTGGGLSNNMTIEDRVGDAPNSTSNALSYNMTESDREENVPT